MNTQHPVTYIVSLLVVFGAALSGYALGLNTGVIIVLILIFAAMAFGLRLLHRRYGFKGMANKALGWYDSSLPSFLPDGEGGISPFDVDGPDTTLSFFPGSVSSGAMDQRVTITEDGGASPTISGILPPGSVPAAPPLEPTYRGYQAQPVNHFQLHLGPQAFVDLAAALTNALILEQPQAGRGSITRVLVEEIARLGVPLLFVDVGDTYGSLLKEFPHGRLVCRPRHEEPIDGVYIPLEPDEEQCRIFGQTLLHEGWQVFFRFASYSPEEAATILLDILGGMATWEEDHAHSVLPCVIILTEANRLLPDDNQQSVVKDLDLAQIVREQLAMGLRDMAPYGLRFYLTTRKITGMDKEALLQCVLWLMRQPPIAEVQAGWISAFTGLDPADLMAVPATHVLAMDCISRMPQVLQFRDSNSRPEGVRASRSTGPFTVPSPVREVHVSTPFQTR